MGEWCWHGTRGDTPQRHPGTLSGDTSDVSTRSRACSHGHRSASFGGSQRLALGLTVLIALIPILGASPSFAATFMAEWRTGNVFAVTPSFSSHSAADKHAFDIWNRRAVTTVVTYKATHPPHDAGGDEKERIWKTNLHKKKIKHTSKESGTSKAHKHTGTFTVFGPETFTRAKGKPVTVKRHFAVHDPTVRYVLRIRNHGMSSAVIRLNGDRIFGPDDFNHKKSSLKKVVRLHASNTLGVELRGKPGSRLSIKVTGLDPGAPIITATVNPAPNANGWHHTDVTVTFDCRDQTSGIASCPEPVTVTTEGNNQVITGTARDNAGNEATTSVSLNIDKTAPTISAAASPDANANGWNNSNVSVIFACTDALSGVAACPATALASNEGANQVITGEATDLAGNTATISFTLNIDKTAPVIQSAAAPQPNANGWNNGDTTVTFNATDALSGIASVTPPVTVTSEGAGQIVTGTATDRAGNSATATVTINLDKSAPTIAGTLSPAPNANRWNNSDVTVTFDCQDATSGIAACSSPIVVSTEGVDQTISGTATDQAGHSATASVAVNLDKTPPNINISSPADGATLTDSPVTVTGTITDALAGVGQVTCNGTAAALSNSTFSCDLPLTEGANAITIEASDLAGNLESSSISVTLVTDVVPPTVLLTAPDADTEFLSGTLVTIEAVASDDRGVDRVEFLVDGVVVATDTTEPYSASVPIDVPPGIQDVTVSAAAFDLSGNRAESAPVVIRVVNDVEPPTVEIINPTDGSKFVEETLISVAATAGDNIAVDRVEFSVAGTVFASDDMAPFTASLTLPSSAAAPTIAITATAFDRVGLFASHTVTVELVDDQPPTITLTQAPADGSEILEGTTVHLEATATDDLGVVEVNLLLNGKGIDSQDTAPFSFNFEIPPFATVTNPIEVVLVARDTKGQTASTPPLRLNVLELDRVPPAVAQIDPADGSDDFPVNGVIVVRFTEPLAVDSVVPGVVKLFEQTNEVAGSIAVSDDGLSVTFKPGPLLAGFAEHSVEVVGVRDVVGNQMTETFSSSFTTGQFVDTEAPRVIHTSPPNQQTDVPVNAPYTVEFSERMDPATLTTENFRIRDAVTSQNVPGMVQVDPDGRTASFVPEQPFGVQRLHSAIFSAAITDAAGNGLVGTRGFTFTTSFEEDNEPPHLIAISPANSMSNVPLNTRISLGFDEPLHTVNVLRGLHILAGSDVIEGSMALSEGNRVITFTPASNLSPNTLHAVQVTTEITDLVGHPLANPGSSGFQTGDVTDLTQPTVTAVAPQGSEVPTNAIAQLQFSERINPFTVSTSNFFIELNVSPFTRVAGTVAVAADGLSATFTPDNLLAPATTYRVQAFSIQDLGGNFLSSVVTGFVTAEIPEPQTGAFATWQMPAPTRCR